MNPQQTHEISAIKKHVLKYCVPNDIAAWRALAVTAAYFILTAIIFYLGFPILSLTIMSLNYLRLFVQFHDMAHYSYFKDLKTNTLVGRVIGVLTYYPFDAWRDGHNHHHKHFGNLDRFDASQTILFTKAKYESMPTGLKIFVRVLRQPVVFFFISTPFLWFVGLFYVVARRYGVFSRAFFDKCCSLLIHVVIANLFGLEVALMQFAAPYFGNVVGVMLFHLQHAVNMPYRQRKDKWNFERAALQGSTFLDVPWILKPFTDGIEFHHIHHLNTNVASYNMQQCHNTFSKQQNKGDRWEKQGHINQVEYSRVFKSLFNVMFDQQSGQLLPFSYSHL